MGFLLIEEKSTQSLRSDCWSWTLLILGLIKFPANMKQADVIVLPEVKSHNRIRQFHLQSAIYGVSQVRTGGPLEEALNEKANQRWGPPMAPGEEGKSSVLVLSAIASFSSVWSFLLDFLGDREFGLLSAADWGLRTVDRVFLWWVSLGCAVV